MNASFVHWRKYHPYRTLACFPLMIFHRPFKQVEGLYIPEIYFIVFTGMMKTRVGTSVNIGLEPGLM